MTRTLGWFIAGLLLIVIVQQPGTGAGPAAVPAAAQQKILYGRIDLAFKKQQLSASRRVKIPPGSFTGRPVVIVSESGSAGSILIAKAEHFEKDSFLVTGVRHNPGRNKTYQASIGWIAIGKPGKPNRPVR